MVVYDERLSELSEKLRQKTRLETKINELAAIKSILEENKEKLKIIMDKEQADVERLEKGGLKAFWYEIIGKSEEKLSKEKEEAYNAMLKYDSAMRELADISENIEMLENELKPLWYVEEDYEKAYAEKRNAIKKSGNPAAEELMECERVLQFLINEEKELGEAIEAGNKARKIAEKLIPLLEDAEKYSYHDLAFKNDTLAGFKKYELLEEASELSEQLSFRLRDFKAELAEVEINSDLEISVDPDERFIDLFFDSVFTNYKVLNDVRDLIPKAQELKSKIAYALAMLTDKLDENRKEQAELGNKLEELILKTKI